MDEVSCGIIPVRFSTVWEFFLVQHTQSLHWGFPKGKQAQGETLWQTACRELEEETCLQVVQQLCSEPWKERYVFSRKGRSFEKEVYYYLAEVVGSVSILPQEIAQGAWLPGNEALICLTYEGARCLLQEVLDFLHTRRFHL